MYSYVPFSNILQNLLILPCIICNCSIKSLSNSFIVFSAVGTWNNSCAIDKFCYVGYALIVFNFFLYGYCEGHPKPT